MLWENVCYCDIALLFVIMRTFSQTN